MTKFGKTLIASVVLGAAVISTGASAQVIYVENNRNVERGTAAMMKGDLENASKYYRRAARANLSTERMVAVLNNLCAVDYALGNLEKAEEACDDAIGLDRRYWRAYVNRGNVHKAQGDVESAHKDYARAVEIKPNGELPKRALARLISEQPRLLAKAN